MSKSKTHQDGSKTFYKDSGESTTQNRDGSVRETTEHTQALGIFGKDVTVTRDGSGNVINRQDGHGKK